MQTTRPITARRIEATPEALVIVLADRTVTVPWDKCSARVAQATPAERATLDLSPGGYGIHWPLLDEDLSIAGLVQA